MAIKVTDSTKQKLRSLGFSGISIKIKDQDVTVSGKEIKNKQAFSALLESLIGKPNSIKYT